MVEIPRYDRNKYFRIMDRTQSNYANQLTRISRDAKRSDFILIYYSLALIIYSLSVKFYPHLFDETWTSYSGIILSIIVLIYSIINSKARYSERITKIQFALNEVKRLKREVGALPDLSCQCENGGAALNSSAQEEDSAASFDPSQQAGNTACSAEPVCPSARQSACIKLEALKKEYDELVSNTEIRDDIDFYRTIRGLCKRYNIKISTGKYKGSGNSSQRPPEELCSEIKGYIAENNPRLQQLHIFFIGLWHLCLYLTPIVIFAVSFLIKFLEYAAQS